MHLDSNRLPHSIMQTSNGTSDANNYEFAALRGVQAGTEYFVVMIPLRLVSRLFRFDEDDLPPNLRAQRVLNKARVPAIARYMVEHPTEYVLSALCASVDGSLDFTPLEAVGPLRMMGKLRISMTGTLLINDGQHRRAAIEAALHDNPGLRDESIAVVMFADRGLRRAQQMFADLNLHAVRPSRSIGVLYNHRDPLAVVVRQVTQAVPLFRDFTELERTSISNRSLKLFTLSSLYQGTRELLGGPDAVDPDNSTAASQRAVEFWEAVVSHMPDWQAVASRKVGAAELRRDYVHAHGVALHALGIAGKHLVAQFPDTWQDHLGRVTQLDWSRRNTKQWEGSVLVAGRVQKTGHAVNTLVAALLEVLGVQPVPVSSSKALHHSANN